MKYTIFLMLIFFLAAFAYAGGEMEGDQNTLSIYHSLDLADAVSADNFKVLQEEFERLNPDIAIEWEFLINEPYHNKLQTMAVADQLPDVFFLWPGKRTGSVTGSGKAKDLRPWLEGKEDEFAGGALGAQGPNGEIWELPEQMTFTHVMFTNERLLQELNLSFPRTMDELLAQGDAIRAAGYIPIAMDNKDGWQMQSTFLSMLVERTGGMDWYKAAIKGEGASFSDEEFVNALAIVDTLTKEQMFSPGINQAEYGRALTDFVTEKAVYLIDGGWRVAQLTGELTDDQQQYVSLNVFPDVPNQKGESRSTASVPGTGFGMNANLDDEKAELAWKWVWFYSGPEGSAIKATQGWSPAYILPDSPDAPALKKRLGEFAKNRPIGYVLDAVLDAEGMAVLQTGIQKMMFGELSPRQVATEYETWVAANDSARK